MDHISEHINSTKHNIHSYDHMIKMIVNLSIKKSDNNGNSFPQLYRLHNSLLMRIIDTPEKYLSNFEGKYDTSKVQTSSVNSSSKLFSCSVREIYNRFHSAQKQSLVVKS